MTRQANSMWIWTILWSDSSASILSCKTTLRPTMTTRTIKKKRIKKRTKMRLWTNLTAKVKLELIMPTLRKLRSKWCFPKLPKSTLSSQIAVTGKATPWRTSLTLCSQTMSELELFPETGYQPVSPNLHKGLFPACLSLGSDVRGCDAVSYTSHTILCNLWHRACI